MEQLSQLLQDFINWLLSALWPREHGRWCAVFYFVGQKGGRDLPVDDPGGVRTLDTKIHEAIEALTSASVDPTRLDVVYRAIWADQTKEPVRCALPENPEINYFRTCYQAPVLPPINTGDDLPCFLSWVYQKRPADHYAIFFLGHSFGPAGLFEPRTGIPIPHKPPLTLRSLKIAFERFNSERRKPPEGPPSSRMAAIGGVQPGTTAADYSAEVKALEALGLPTPKVDLVVFQDCWMSTLETAYELQDVVDYVIASQSLVPIRIQDPDFIWPYKKLLKDLLKPGFQRRVTQRIWSFYGSRRDEIPPLATVPFALLDLSKVAGVTGPLKDMVHSLNGLTPERRATAIENARIIDLNPPPLSAGDAALVDVPRMCEALKNDTDPSTSAAAKSLGAALHSMIKLTRESLPTGTEDRLGFGGVSVLYWPPPAPNEPKDNFITDALFNAFYLNLKFQDTNVFGNDVWPALEHEP